MSSEFESHKFFFLSSTSFYYGIIRHAVLFLPNYQLEEKGTEMLALRAILSSELCQAYRPVFHGSDYMGLSDLHG